MSAAIPSTAPPAGLGARALPMLATAVAQAAPSGPSALLPPLTMFLRTLARLRLTAAPASPPLGPLHAFVSLAREDPRQISLPLALDALLAYPAETGLMSKAFKSITPFLSDELEKLLSADLQPKATSLLAYSRLVHALLRLPATQSLVKTRKDAVVSSLDNGYDCGSDRDAVRAKAEALLLLRALGGAKLPERRGVPLRDQSLGSDYALFSTTRPGQDETDVLRAIHDDERRDDPRLGPLLTLFPTLPSHLLADALVHPAFRPGPRKAEEEMAPLVDAILAGTLPQELSELRAAASAMNAEPDVPAQQQSSSSRRGAWDSAELSKLRVRGTEESVAPGLSDNMRASILRAVEMQQEEAEAAARAIAEAHGVAYKAPRYDSEPEDDEQPRVRVAEGDESDEDGPSEAPTPSRENTMQTALEVAYVRDPTVFGRDAATRRSKARADLRELTGMDDGQIEGWRVMLERNPHKDAILERHQYASVPTAAANRAQGESSRGGGGGGRGGRGGGGGRGGAGGGSGGQGQGGQGSGRGGAGGRGKPNKGSRGHSNAARTRGHDKKMSRMGVGS